MSQEYIEAVKYSTGWKRIGAAIVDAIVFSPFLLVNKWLLQNEVPISIHITWSLFSTFAPIFYSVWLHHKYGQTIGKWVAGVKVVHVSEQKNLTLKQAFLRDSFYIAVEVIGLLLFIQASISSSDVSYIIPDYDSFADLPATIWLLLEITSMLTNKKRRAVHDFLASSVVIRYPEVVAPKWWSEAPPQQTS